MRSSSLRVFAYVETELPAMGKCVEPDSGPLARRQTSPPMWTSEKTITKKPNKKLTVRSEQPQSTLALFSITTPPRWFLGQPTVLSKKVCLFAGVNWLNSSVSQTVVRGQQRLNNNNNIMVIFKRLSLKALNAL